MKREIDQVIKPLVILLTIGVVTILNKWFIQDRFDKWQLTLVAIAFYLSVYALADVIRKRNTLNIIIFFIFVSELVATLLGWNLLTEYYTELILSLVVLGFFNLIKLWVKR